jgi:hypothetical protein
MKKVKVLDPDFEGILATVDYVSVNDGNPYAKLRFEDGRTGIFFLDEFEVVGNE